MPRLKAFQNINLLRERLPQFDLVTEYVGYKKDMTVKCSKCGHEITKTVENLLKMKGCPKCNGRARSKEETIKHIHNLAPFIEILGEANNNLGHPLLCKCKICGYTWNVDKNYFYRNHKMCPACTGHTHVDGINTLKDTDPELFLLVKDKELYNNISRGSHKIIEFVCPNCGETTTRSVNTAVKLGISCKRCGDGISYPNKFVYSFLSQLNVEFETEVSFNWSNKKRYDFYIPTKSIIIEVHGSQHYEEAFHRYLPSARSLDEEISNDCLKFELAVSNGVSKYIVIDARDSNKFYIANSIINSELSAIFSFAHIDFNKCDEYATSSQVFKACKMYEQGLSKIKISELLNVSAATIGFYIKKGASIGLFNEYYSILANMKNYVDGVQPVLCLTTNEIFPSAVKAYKAKHISAKSMFECLEGKISYAGVDKDTNEVLMWQYINEETYKYQRA